MPIQTLITQRLYQQAAEQISGLIDSGEIALGARLPPERDLAKLLGVSRPTVREAMIALEIAGRVEIRVGSGIYVKAPTKRLPSALSVRMDVGPSPFELLAARMTLEGEIAAQAAERVTRPMLAEIEETLVGLQADLRRGDLGQQNDRLFHRLIADATGNSVLTNLVEQLWEGMFAPIFHNLSTHVGLPANLKMTIADHERIFGALKPRDPVEARAAMRMHLQHVEEILQGADDLADMQPLT